MTDPDTNGIPKGDEPVPLVVQVERMAVALADMRAERDRLAAAIDRWHRLWTGDYPPMLPDLRDAGCNLKAAASRAVEEIQRLTADVDVLTDQVNDISTERDTIRRDAAVALADMREQRDTEARERVRVVLDLEQALGLLTRIRECVTDTGGVYYSREHLGTDGLVGVWVRDVDPFLAAHR